MRLQKRDVLVIREIAMHGVVSRDQVIALGFFTSIPRANARLCPLTSQKFLKRVEGSRGFLGRQSLYYASTKATPLLDERIAQLLAERKHGPRFVDHSLMVVDVRVQLNRLGGASWKHECQIRHRYRMGTTVFEFRPDGLIYVQGQCLYIEADRGNASKKSLRETFYSYDRYASSGTFKATYKRDGFRVLVVTLGERRAKAIRSLAKSFRVAISVTTLDALGSATGLRDVLS